MKKLLGILVLGYRIMWDNWQYTGNERDKTRFELVWMKKSRANSGKSYRKLVIIYSVSGTAWFTLVDLGSQ